MIKLINLFYFLIFLSVTSNAQIEVTSLAKGKLTGKKIMKKYAKYLSKGIKEQILTFTKQEIKNDTLQYETDMYLKYTKYRFGFKDVKNNNIKRAVCNYYEFTSDCNVCGQRYLDKTLGSVKWEFRQLDGSTYISNYKYKIKLEIEFLNKDKECLIFTYTPYYLSEHEYKKLYNSLPK